MDRKVPDDIKSCIVFKSMWYAGSDSIDACKIGLRCFSCLMTTHPPNLVNIALTDIVLHCLLEITWPCEFTKLSLGDDSTIRWLYIVQIWWVSSYWQDYTAFFESHGNSRTHCFDPTYRWISKIRNINFTVALFLRKSKPKQLLLTLSKRQ